MTTAEPRPIPAWLLALFAVAVGVIAGFGAVVFRWMIAFFHNFLFLGQLSFLYNANQHTPPSPWGPLVILVPVLGGMVVVFLVKTFAPEAKGHGVPEVMDAIWYKDGIIRPVVAAIKSVASALSIGSGGSVGREGPIIQIGAAFGSTLGQMVAMPTRDRVVLIAAGAGGGIAATFNTPIGGIAFAVELMLAVVSARSLLAVALATVTATYIGRLFMGMAPAFNVPRLAELEAPGLPLTAYPWFVLLGLLVGLLSVAMVRGIYWFEDRFDAMPGNSFTRHAFGMVLVGLLFYGFMKLSGPLFGQQDHYYVEGVGYATILDVLNGKLTSPGFLLLLVGAKLLATCLTLGSGASGGVFSPSLYQGAALGGFVGGLVQMLPHNSALLPAYFALAGMAGMVAGTTGAVVTATVMVFEMTRDYATILPVILTVALACSVRQWLCPPTIYTLKLLRRGHAVPQALHGWLDGARRAEDVMTGDFVTVDEGTTPDNTPINRPLVVVSADGQMLGALDFGSEPGAPGKPVVVEPGDRLPDVIRALDEAGTKVALVMRDRRSNRREDLLGIISDRQLAGLARSEARLTE